MELNIPSLFPVRSRWDETEFNQLFLEYYSRMCSVAFRIVGDPDQAEDLASEAFWRLWESPPAKKDNTSGWLYRVTTHLAYNALRSSRRRSSYERAALDNVAGRQGISVEESLNRKEQLDQIRHLLQQMPRRDVQLLVLRYSGLSYKEIASALSLNPASVGTLLNRAENHFALLQRKAENDAS